MSKPNGKLDLINQVSRLIAEKLVLEVSSPQEDLLSSGAVDSLSLIQLLVTLEEHFGVRIPLRVCLKCVPVLLADRLRARR